MGELSGSFFDPDRPGFALVTLLRSAIRRGVLVVQAVDCVDEGRWWVVHTLARHEKALARDLERKAIDYYLPLARVERRWGRRRAQIQIPLFPGYLFMRGGEEERLSTVQTKRVARVINVHDQQRLKEALGHIRRMVESGRPVDLYPGIRKGRRCRIVRGPLRGLEGVVLRRQGVFRVFVAVEILGQSAETEIDGASLEVSD